MSLPPEAHFREVLKTNHGKEAVWHFLGICDMYLDVEGEYQRGKRAVGLELIRLLELVDPHAYPRLIMYFNKVKEGEPNGRDTDRGYDPDDRRDNSGDGNEDRGNDGRGDEDRFYDGDIYP